MKKTVLTTGTFLFFLSAVSYSQTSHPLPGSALSAISNIKKTHHFEYIISGLSTASDEINLIALINSRPGIINSTADLAAHTVTIYTPENMLESDVLEILKFAGKTVIDNPKAISKFY